MKTEERVFIAGAGPVGLVAAADLVRRGVPVTVFEALRTLSKESRASTFHPPTLDMLDELGVTADLIEKGVVAPKLQYRLKRQGLVVDFDFGAIASHTRHPYRVQSEQFKLTRILLGRLRNNPNFRIEFRKGVHGVSQDRTSVTVYVERNGRFEERKGRWLIGADGARSEVRRALKIEFEGFTWQERFLVISTPFDFRQIIPNLASVSYVSDPLRWHFFLQIPGLWRVMFPVMPDVSDEAAISTDYGRSVLASVVPGSDRYDIAHTTLYRVHQRVAKRYRVGRVFLAGDAAHINNPLGGMGMNSGIHDALNLTERLTQIWDGKAPNHELDRYDRQRRLITLEVVQAQSIQNKRNLEGRDVKDQMRFCHEMQRIIAHPDLTRDFLLKVSLISSLRRAAELG